MLNLGRGPGVWSEKTETLRAPSSNSTWAQAKLTSFEFLQRFGGGVFLSPPADRCDISNMGDNRPIGPT